MNEFSYYFNGVRHTETDLDFLTQLTKDLDNSAEVVEGIIESKKRWDEEGRVSP